ncbi:hypothetical protein QQF64_031230 [Cirrhinus molitorella]|uniref:Uncharacterized protein n=1 Tax=Cirrhinus molitorella TaxID=172907 RepID=A0ABR3MWG2_9TELE
MCPGKDTCTRGDVCVPKTDMLPFQRGLGKNTKGEKSKTIYGIQPESTRVLSASLLKLEKIHRNLQRLLETVSEDLFQLGIVKSDIVKERLVLYANVTECHRSSPQKTIVSLRTGMRTSAGTGGD